MAAVDRLHAKEDRRRRLSFGGVNVDIPFLVLLLALLAVGLTMLYSASYVVGIYRMGDSAHYIKNQLMFASVGVVAMLAMICMNTQIIRQKRIRLQNLEEQKEELVNEVAEIEQRIEAAKSEEAIRQYALENGIVLGN